MLRRLFSFLLIVFAHLLVLQLLLHFLNKTQVAQVNVAEVVPVSVIADTPSEVKVKVQLPPKTSAPKKPLPIPTAHKTTHTDAPTSTEATPPSEPNHATDASKPIAQDESILLSLAPPSASYLLDVIRTEPKLANPYHGAGKILWHHDNKNYTMQIQLGVDVLFTTIDLYNMHSEGVIGETGLQPIKTTESRRTKDSTTTHFNYDTKSISFSADPTMIPLLDGAQDKITVLMQLASFGNANPAQFEAGKEFVIQVGEEKEAHLHQFLVLDKETIASPLGQLKTWHLVRPPRPGLYSSRIDVWLAPELNWLPVQIRNTEANGAVTTQTIRRIIQE